MTDSELLNGFAAGNLTAGRQFVDQYQLKVYNVCYGFLQNAHDAEDVAQDVFIEAVRNAEKFRGEAKLGTWLYRIAVNRSLNFIRDHKKHRFWRNLDAGFSVDSVRGGAGGSEPSTRIEPLEQKEQRSLIMQAVGSLPEKQRTAFTLNKIEDLSYAEVAEVMQTSLSSVESLIFRAREGLQKKLKKYYKEDPDHKL